MRSSFGAAPSRPRGQRRLLVRRVLVLLALDQLDPVVDQVGVEVLDLLLRELDVLEPGDDLVVGQEALLVAVLNELLKLFDVRQRDIDGEHEPRLSRVRDDVLTYLNTQRAGRKAASPGSLS